MEKFKGSKYYVKEEYSVKDDSRWWDDKAYLTKTEFGLTRQYRDWLNERKAKQKRQEIAVLKAKLEWQYKTYGEVDPIDFGEYMAKIKA